MPTPDNWQAVREEILQTLQDVEPLTTDLMALRGDFVLERTFLPLLNTMKQRQMALQQVLEMKELPTTPDEMESFRKFLKSYLVLVRELQQLNLSIAAYLHEREGGTTS